ncbi:MAG: hypothetical protein H0U44_09795 [Flavisolibacter sp.]|jgi:TRAP-type uncharacterized transport system substrate-binding protein|nr:hypothetical protein [Flavisolibacter sp.]
MKKFFLMFAVAGALVACNNESATTTHSDSMNMTTTPTTVTPDTFGTGMDTSMNRTDTSMNRQ